MYKVVSLAKFVQRTFHIKKRGGSSDSDHSFLLPKTRIFWAEQVWIRRQDEQTSHVDRFNSNVT
jgi:hypothetical protein